MARVTPESTPFVLIIRDGWGENPHLEQDEFNAVRLARTPVDDALRRDWPWTLIRTSGEDVGLPEGTMGNSEVGHQNIGAGRIVDQDSVRISKACRTGTLKDNEAIMSAIVGAKKADAAVHLMGICSDAGVHGLLEHLYALLRVCAQVEAPRVFLHLFTDGRDTGPFTGNGFVEDVERELARHAPTAGGGGGAKVDREAAGLPPAWRIASVMGRYWAMDRDNRWERVARAYACLTGHDAQLRNIRSAATAAEAVQDYYDHPAGDSRRGDEFVEPAMIGRSSEEVAHSRISDGDAVIFYNYRGDRPREIVSAFVLPEFHGSELVKPSPDSGDRGFDRGPRLDLRFVMMTAYSELLRKHAAVAFEKPPKMENIGGGYISSLGLTQLRCAETEKYPHVTFFFNDYRDEPFPGERRENPQSPKVATYDQKPEMSARQVCDDVLVRLKAPDGEDFIVVNFANGDMVGHTGNLAAAVSACETVDGCVGEIIEAVLARGGSLIVTADHGNAEQMWDPQTNSPHTAHTVYDVPLFVVGDAFRGMRLRGDQEAAGWFDAAVRAKRGRLADIFPTALAMMGLDRPEGMTGESLLV
jgi:2,3-bisphosphoglycerate-independent phosphoglycerate mutase